MSKSWSVEWTASSKPGSSAGQMRPLIERVGNACRAGAHQEVLQLSRQYESEVVRSPSMLNAVGLSAQALGDHGKAMEAFKWAIGLAPDYPDPHNNLGMVLRRNGQYADALESYKTAIRLRPEYPEAYSNLANLLLALKHFAEAEAAYRSALRLRPGFVDARWGLSHLLLSLGRYAEGWPHYESRLDPALSTSMPTPRWHIPRWRGEPLKGRSILVWFEQGLGDGLQFCRYLPLLRNMGVARLTIACHDPLSALMENATGADGVWKMGDLHHPGPHDFWTPLLSLPLAFNTTLDNIPDCIEGFSAPVSYRQKWRHQIKRDKFSVGLVWKGNPAHKDDTNRSIPDPAMLLGLISTRDATFFSLQKGSGEEAAEALAAGCENFQHLGGRLDDLADTAACMEELDLVVSVDTAVAHLAGSLGKPCWVLLPYVDTDWRWLQDREDSPWYPSLRLFRQAKPHDWHSVLKMVAESLPAAISSKKI